ncbi:conserved hypothetical protein [Neospora caninum Liverpool]|uniref:Uncharacterized protein n=1 Tax=Neospora caninum (strain Liverpool) TaxID=572307 RepID=F0VMY2_NEOCL|nr:conserved hypothetical protein [Neospora caninum Liverpool]CBZ55078.1 conserved hypothetical protein [Neospora caninum Liverpool]CEL69802.1 TPA: hypothetical protein BN1204_055030 [Neospora caninum Liverpool]|eukprot:XP_003885106.1 conserved hypothetical protein [Neospora caninum Liverpool]
MLGMTFKKNSSVTWALSDFSSVNKHWLEGRRLEEELINPKPRTGVPSILRQHRSLRVLSSYKRLASGLRFARRKIVDFAKGRSSRSDSTALLGPFPFASLMATHNESLQAEPQGRTTAKRLFAWTEDDRHFAPLPHGGVTCLPAAPGSACQTSCGGEASTVGLPGTVGQELGKRRRLLGPDGRSRVVSGEDNERKVSGISAGSRMTAAVSTAQLSMPSHFPAIGEAATTNHVPMGDESEELGRTSSVSSVEVDMVDAGGGSPPRLSPRSPPRLSPTGSSCSGKVLAHTSGRTSAKESVANSESRSADFSQAQGEERKNENCYAIMPFLSETAAQIPRPLGEGELSLDALLHGASTGVHTPAPLSEMINDPEVAKLLRDQPANPLESLEQSSEGFLLTEVLRKKREARLKKAIRNVGRMGEGGVSLRALYDLCESDKEESEHERETKDPSPSGALSPDKDGEDASMD